MQKSSFGSKEGVEMSKFSIENVKFPKERNLGVILAGGPGSRLLPLTKTINKHLLPVGPYPMIYHPLIDLIKLGVKDIFIVTGHEHMGGFTEQLGDGSKLGVNITYVVQQQPNGIGGALGLVIDRVARFMHVASLAASGVALSGSRLIVVLGDNIFNHEAFVSKVRNTMLKNNTVDVFIKRVKDNNRFGVPSFSSYNDLLKVDEKPEIPVTDYAMVGFYMFKMNLVLGMMKDFMFGGDYRKSERGEYEITDILNWLAMKSETVHWIRVMCNKLNSTFWTDAGTHASLHKANEYMENYRFWANLD